MKVSLLSPVHNEERFLGEMLASVKAQTHQDWELLLVNDGSTDSTASIITEAAAGDRRIRLISNGAKIGAVAAYNLAFENCVGDVIAILGGDDLLPLDSLALRAAALLPCQTEPAAAFFKLKMFSQDPKFDDLIVPRGKYGSRSGPSITMNRPLAHSLFPIPSDLPNEDVWLGEAAEDVATTVIEHPGVVVHYRVHEGNSNPRHKSFEHMSDALHRRSAAWSALLDQERFHLSEAKRRRLCRLAEAEELRYEGRTLRILAVSGLPIVDRLALASSSNRVLHRLRTHFYKFFSGRRRR